MEQKSARPLPSPTVDDGSTWSKVELEKSESPYGWRTWSFVWNASPGKRTLLVRAIDAHGNLQPVDQESTAVTATMAYSA